MRKIDPRDCQHGKADTEQEVADMKQASPASAPAGWKLVPVEPTAEMKLAWIGHKSFEGCYQAMLAATPTPVRNKYRAEGMRMAADFVEPQRNNIPATGYEFAVAIRAKADELNKEIQNEPS